MESNQRSSQALPSSGVLLAPIHSPADSIPLRLCILVRAEPDPVAGSFFLLRELPGARVYLGASCDAAARVQEWLEVWVQTLELRDLAFSSYQERLTNYAFDQRWRAEFEMSRENLPQEVIVTGMEAVHPAPILIKRRPPGATSPLAPVEVTPWRLCTDDALLDSFGLPPYTTSPFRYLHEAAATSAKTFLSTASDAPVNSHVQPLERLSTLPDVQTLFNPQAGLVRVNRFTPLLLEDYLQILEGRPWGGAAAELKPALQQPVYAQLQEWSPQQKATPFLLHSWETSPDKLNEIFFLKLSALLNMLQQVRAYSQAQQLPLLNLSPASFAVQLQEAGPQFPALWSARCLLVKPGQAYPLKIKSTEQRYFIRLGRIEPSPFLPEGLGAHSFGIGNIRVRNVASEADGIVLEGTLVAEDYLAPDPHDLLWFKLPLTEERLEFYAHVYTSEAVGPKEARFRTVPTKLPDTIVAALRHAAAFAKSPYEIWPLLSSPCDLHSLGIIAIRVLLANSTTNLSIVVDDLLSLARHLGKDPLDDQKFLDTLKSLLERETKLRELVSPRLLVERDWSSQEAWSHIHKELWIEAVALLLRLFPGAGSQSFCKNFGDVSPLALETVFDRPIEELEKLVLRLRSVLVPGLFASEEIASVILEQLVQS